MRSARVSMSPNPTGPEEFFPVPVRQSPIRVAQHGKLAGTALTG